MEKSCFTATALPLLLATFKNVAAFPLQIERPARSLPEVVELNDKVSFVREEASSRAEVCLKKGPLLVYGDGQLPDSKTEEVGSKKRKFSSSVTWIRKRKSKTPTRSECRKEGGVRISLTNKAGVQEDEERVARVSREVKTENIKKLGKERTKEVE